MVDRGVTLEEVEETVRNGERVEARSGRVAFSKNFPYGDEWKGTRYAVKGVQVIAIHSGDDLVVVTVYSFYF